MQNPPDRRCYPYCGRHPEIYRLIPAEDSDNSSTTSSASIVSEPDDLRESDEEFIEVDSEAWHSAEDYRDQTATSVGSSELWEDEVEEHAADDDDDDNIEADNDKQETTKLLNSRSADVFQVLGGAFTSESSMANSYAVMCSLDVDTGENASQTQGVRDARDGEAGTLNSQDRVTSK